MASSKVISRRLRTLSSLSEFLHSTRGRLALAAAGVVTVAAVAVPASGVLSNPVEPAQNVPVAASCLTEGEVQGLNAAAGNVRADWASYYEMSTLDNAADPNFQDQSPAIWALDKTIHQDALKAAAAFDNDTYQIEQLAQGKVAQGAQGPCAPATAERKAVSSALAATNRVAAAARQWPIPEGAQGFQQSDIVKETAKNAALLSADAKKLASQPARRGMR